MILHIGCELNALKTKMSEYHSLIASIILLFKSPIARPADLVTLMRNLQLLLENSLDLK